mmetsp:Transcript_39673/g.63474  ORF Transcript_39673/g.63474 Transcript_39673/m.63474 type:complete len:217 (-) Transcript_39673:33-683(-)
MLHSVSDPHPFPSSVPPTDASSAAAVLSSLQPVYLTPRASHACHQHDWLAYPRSFFSLCLPIISTCPSSECGKPGNLTCFLCSKNCTLYSDTPIFPHPGRFHPQSLLPSKIESLSSPLIYSLVHTFSPRDSTHILAASLYSDRCSFCKPNDAPNLIDPRRRPIIPRFSCMTASVYDTHCNHISSICSNAHRLHSDIASIQHSLLLLSSLLLRCLRR